MDIEPLWRHLYGVNEDAQVEGKKKVKLRRRKKKGLPEAYIKAAWRAGEKFRNRMLGIADENARLYGFSKSAISSDQKKLQRVFIWAVMNKKERSPVKSYREERLYEVRKMVAKYASNKTIFNKIKEGIRRAIDTHRIMKDI